MRYIIILLLLGCGLSSANAQTDSVYAYYDLRWTKLDGKTDAEYFRVVKDRADGKYVVRDYIFQASCSLLRYALFSSRNL